MWKFCLFLKSRFLPDNKTFGQPHLAQCYSRTRRIALILCGAHESVIYFEVQPGVN